MNKKLERTIFELSHSTCKTAFFITFPDNLSWQQVHVLWVGNLHFTLHLIFPLTFLHPPWSLASSLQLSYSTQKKVEEPKANFFSSQTCFANMQYLGEEIRGDPRFPKQKNPTILWIPHFLHLAFFIFQGYFKVMQTICDVLSIEIM